MTQVDNELKFARPPLIAGMRHVALVVEDLAACERFCEIVELGAAGRRSPANAGE